MFTYCTCLITSMSRSTVDEKEQKQLLMDLKVVMDSSDCPYIVQFYGAIFKVWTNELSCFGNSNKFTTGG